MMIDGLRIYILTVNGLLIREVFMRDLTLEEALKLFYDNAKCEYITYTELYNYVVSALNTAV